jgi:diguanylate cyclase
VCVQIPWDRIPAWWLHSIPLLATLSVATGIRLAGLYGDIASYYYILIAVFAAYAFSSRRAVAAHVALISVASALPLLYASQPTHEPARVAVGLMLLVVIAAIVTLLREGLERRQGELEQMALRDPLTGVGNYRLLSERLEYELARHRRTGAPLSVMLLDLDGFKEVNDTFGHLMGDRVLTEVANTLASSIRAGDTLARQGGDEFSILAPETRSEGAQRLATRVQQAVAAAMGGAVTTSVGWATFPADADDAITLLALADTDLRRAKRNPAPDRDSHSPGAPAAGPVLPRAPGAILRVVEPTSA